MCVSLDTGKSSVVVGVATDFVSGVLAEVSHLQKA